MKRKNNGKGDCWEQTLREDDFEVSQNLESRLDTLIRRKSTQSKPVPAWGTAWASGLVAILLVAVAGWILLWDESREQGARDLEDQIAHSGSGASPLPEELFVLYDLLSGADDALFSQEDEWVFQEWIFN